MKLNLTASILLASIILGGFYYSVQIHKQKSIETQQQIELQNKTEQDKKDYLSKQKTACLDIYQVEGKKWNNVNGWIYNDVTDKCEITYKDKDKKTEQQCNDDLTASKETFKDEVLPPYVFSAYLSCLDGTFTKEF